MRQVVAWARLGEFILVAIDMCSFLASMAILLVAYGFIGTETFSVTAFEAYDRNSLRFPARYVAYIISAIYLVSALLECVIVWWKNDKLQQIVTVPHPNRLKRAEDPPDPWLPIMVVAAGDNHTTALYFMSCIIYFCLSAANTALYISSRTLFGLTRTLVDRTSVPFYLQPFQIFGRSTTSAKVPHVALFASFIAFYWIIPLHITKKEALTDVSRRSYHTTSNLDMVLGLANIMFLSPSRC